MTTLLRPLLGLLTGICLLGPAQAQTISNLNFETWAQRSKSVPTGVEAPVNWQTTDDYLSDLAGSPLPSSTGTVSKSTDVRSGSFAARIENKVYAPFQSIIPVFPGILSLGNAIKYTTDELEFTGVPYTSRPTQIQFYYKLTGPAAANDSAAVFFSLTRNVSGKTQQVAFIGALLAPAATYTAVTIPVTYSTAILPDSLHLTFISSAANRPTVGTVLYVDDITIGTAVTATRDAALAAMLTVWPNPSADGRFTLQTTDPVLLAAPLRVQDATGRVVHREETLKPAASRTLDLSSLARGFYTLQLYTAKGLVTKKLSLR